LVLARAARGALPQHFFSVDVAKLALPLAGEQRFLCLQDNRLRIQLLARTPRRAVHLTPPAFDAGEGVEHHLAAEILHRLEADFLLVEIEVRQVAELRRLEEDSYRRQHEMEVLRCRN